jgi:hypothetical protein
MAEPVQPSEPRAVRVDRDGDVEVLTIDRPADLFTTDDHREPHLVGR